MSRRRKRQSIEIFISLSPSIARFGDAANTKTLNTLVADFIKGKAHLHYIETYSSSLDASGKPRPELFRADKLHFNAEGYKILANCVDLTSRSDFLDGQGMDLFCFHSQALENQ